MSGKQVRRQRRRFWIEVGLASAFAMMLVVTLISREWIEAIFGVDPDGGNGTLEWAIVAGLGLAAIAAVLLARKEWRRTISAAVCSAV